MNGMDSVTQAALLARSERNLNENQQNPLTIGALIAIQPNRSVLKDLLGAAKDKLARR